MYELQQWVQRPQKALTGANTVGGFAAKALGRIPEVGDTVVCGQCQMRVVLADRRRAREVLITTIENGDATK